MVRVVRAMVGASKDDVITTTARAFGYARTGHHVEGRMAQAIDRLLAARRLIERVGSLVLGDYPGPVDWQTLCRDRVNTREQEDWRAGTVELGREAGEQHLIHTILKGPRQQIRISLSTFRGHTFGDFRLFVPNQHGEWIPTMKGCTVGIEHLKELEEAVLKLRNAAEPMDPA